MFLRNLSASFSLTFLLRSSSSSLRPSCLHFQSRAAARLCILPISPFLPVSYKPLPFQSPTRGYARQAHKNKKINKSSHSSNNKTHLIDKKKNAKASLLKEQKREQSPMASNSWQVEYSPNARATCKECKQKIEKQEMRLAKVTSSPWGDDGTMNLYFHAKCLFQNQLRARAATTKLEDVSDLQGFGTLDAADQVSVRKLVDEFVEEYAERMKGKKPAKKKVQTTLTSAGGLAMPSSSSSAAPPVLYTGQGTGADETWEEFCLLCDRIASDPSHTAKTGFIKDFIENGSNGNGYTGDPYLLLKLLLPLNPKRVFNMQDKQIMKALSQILHVSYDDMISDLDQGDCSETARKFFAQSRVLPPQTISTLTNTEVDNFLTCLERTTKLEDQVAEFEKILPKCTEEDLRYIVRQLKHDLRIYAGPKNILGALDPNAYEAFQASNDLKDVVERVMERRKGGLTKKLSIRASIMTPVKPMLAEACRDLKDAIRKCPKGMYAEIKYDGERVQIHKKGSQFQFYSRSLKLVTPHKVEPFKQAVPHACPHGDSLILDCEVLMVDNNTGKPLPFGSLGIHKKNEFKDATPCLFVFDILQFNGENIMNKPLEERKKLLEANVQVVKNKIHMAEYELITEWSHLNKLMGRVMREGLEGLVMKDTRSIYEPGKRHWLKVKKDYLDEGAMADSADLVVLGAYYGTGSKGGIMSVFLMGCVDTQGKWRTVCKVGNGHDDATLDRLNKEIDVIKISKDPKKVPSWLLINKNDLVPDFVVPDPKKAPVWEITGAEFSGSNSHSADGISIRFPRVTKIRDDKDWENATDLARLKVLVKASKTHGDSDALPLMDEDEVLDEGQFVPFLGVRKHSAPVASHDPDPSKRHYHTSTSGQDGPLRTSMLSPPPSSSSSNHGPSSSSFNPLKPSSSSSMPRSPAASPSHGRSPTASPRRKSPKPKKPTLGRKRRLGPDESEEDEFDDGSDLLDFIVDDESEEDEYYDDDDSDEEYEDDRDEDYEDDEMLQRARHPPKRRMRVACRYGAKCYRTNPVHKREFSHPGDPDFYPDDDDDQDEMPVRHVANSSSSSLTSNTRPLYSQTKSTEIQSMGDEPSTTTTTTTTSTSTKPQPADSLDLPSMFSGLSMFLSPNLAELPKVKRMLIAYDGDVASESSVVTHIVVQDMDVDFWDDLTKATAAIHPEAVLVPVSWFWDCVKQKTLLTFS